MKYIDEMKNIIFVGGIHGVGKGLICKLIATKMGINHLSSSEVLRWEEISQKSNKLVENLDFTQNRLINGLKKLIRENEIYLLDGHYCLLNSKTEPERVSEDTFQLIAPKIMAIVIEDVEIIHARLKKRDSMNYTLPLLKKMQDMEVNYAKYLSCKLKVPYIEIKNGDYNRLVENIKR